MKRFAALGAATAMLLAAGCAGAPKPGGAIPTTGFLSDEAIAQLTDAVPPAPAPGSVADLADKAASARFVALEDGDRWLLATAHAELRRPWPCSISTAPWAYGWARPRRRCWTG
ncbi:hypothetical protein [Brevundimonas vesicularis]|uniref:hypothetical protein n=1 Tax=Brevundimonas vesicularis TaxID=41276 RepID=UPI0021AA4FAC|nr:hypothetical protein [Brevundimonas vesicularis]